MSNRGVEEKYLYKKNDTRVGVSKLVLKNMLYNSFNFHFSTTETMSFT